MALTKIDDRGLKTPIDLLDNEKIRFGTGNDLEIFHDGSNSYIADTGTGRLLLKGSGIRLHNAAGNENYIHCDDNGAIELYYDNVKKFETIPAGCRVSSGNLYILDNSEINIGNGNDLKIYHNGTNSQINDTTSQLYIQSDLIHYRDWANGHYYCKMVRDGAVELYYDGGKKLETTSTGAILTSGAANTTAVRFGNTANRGLTISTYNNAGNNDSGVVLNAADSENSGYAATLEFDLGGVEFGRFDGNYDIFKLASACNGITFNGDYAAANRLNDYEEGTWTPLLESTGTAFASNTNWSSNSRYTKIGRMVTIQCYQRSGGIDKGSAASTDGIAITGLPFTPTNVVQRSMVPIGQNVNWAGYPNHALVRENIASVELYKSASSGGNNTGTPLTVADVGTAANNNYAIFTLTYETA